MAKSKYKIKTVVLRPILDLSEAEQIVENGKTSLFRSMLQKPKTEWYESDLRSNVTSKIPWNVHEILFNNVN